MTTSPSLPKSDSESQPPIQFTFGSSPAAQSLELLINEIDNEAEREKVRSRISTYMSDYGQILKVIANLDEAQKKQKHFLYQLVVNDLKNNFRKSVPEKIKTHAINVMIARARDCVLRKK